MADVPSTATTPLEKAQELMYRAFDARGRRRIQLARQALELSADCADAYVVLAEESFAPEIARNLYEQGVQAGDAQADDDGRGQTSSRVTRAASGTSLGRGLICGPGPVSRRVSRISAGSTRRSSTTTSCSA